MQASNGRPTHAQIDGAALRANLSTIHARLTHGVAVLAIVKADAYGHGAARVAPLFEAAGVAGFGVATVEEGIEIRRAGVTQPILVLTGAQAGSVEALLEHDLSVALLDRTMLRELRMARPGRPVSVHLKIDTGMGRVGVTPEELPALLEDLRNATEFSLAGIFSHFANADGGNEDFVQYQLRLFREALAIAHRSGCRPPHTHIANSAATLSRPAAHFSMVRPGLALYGIAPMPNCPAPLEPAMRLVTRIVQLKKVPAERPLGYGQTFVTRRPSRIATIPVGYADGYDYRLSNRATVLVHERRAPVVGTVCMDLTLIDVTEVPGVEVNDEVVLWGKQGSATISVNEVADWQNSISYEVLTRLGKRVPRVLDDVPAKRGEGGE